MCMVGCYTNVANHAEDISRHFIFKARPSFQCDIENTCFSIAFFFAQRKQTVLNRQARTQDLRSSGRKSLVTSLTVEKRKEGIIDDSLSILFTVYFNCTLQSSVYYKIEHILDKKYSEKLNFMSSHQSISFA